MNNSIPTPSTDALTAAKLATDKFAQESRRWGLQPLETVLESLPDCSEDEDTKQYRRFDLLGY